MKIRNSFALVLLSIVMFSCGNDDDTPNQPDPMVGNISGGVNLFDEAGMPADNSGMTVNIEGSSIEATTNTDGEFSLIDVPYGDYTLVFQKNDYGTFKRFDVEHNQQATFVTNIPSLSQRSSTEITELSSSTGGGGNSIIVNGRTDPDANNSNPRIIRFFLFDGSDVSDTNFDVVLDPIQVEITPFEFELSQSDLLDQGFQSGQIIFIRCYGESFYANNYEDPTLGRMIYPNVNGVSADAVSFTVP